MTRLLLDEGLPRRAARALRARGLVVDHVGELGMAGAPDESVVDRALELGAAVVTLDSDFAAIVATRGMDGPSLVHLRLQHLDVRACGDVLARVLPVVEADLAAGAIVSVTARGIRVRRLPIRMSGDRAPEE